MPEFEQTLAKLKENEISEPFRTQFGWHIVQLLGRGSSTTPMTTSAGRWRSRCAKPADEETELWLRRLRDEAYVEYKL